jgi:hypothetical protein
MASSGAFMRIDQVIEIQTQPVVLWFLLTEIEQRKRWMPDIVDEELVSGEDSKVGCASRVRIREGSKVVEYTVGHLPWRSISVPLTEALTHRL